MIHDGKKLTEMAWSRRPATGGPPTVAAVNALCDMGVESVILSKKLFDNTQKMLLSAASQKDAKDAARTMSAFVNSTFRDVADNADAVFGIWRRFFRDAPPLIGERAPPPPGPTAAERTPAEA